MTGLVFTANRSTAPTRRETIGNIEYLIVPVVALVPGVLNSELVTAQEITPEDWNGVPVTIGHPQINGEYISARQPAIEAMNPARLYNARIEAGSLKADIYINIAQAQVIGGDVAEAVTRFESGQVVNVSTGYFRDVEPTPGVFNGRAYNGIAHNIRPDQLAILLNEPGACSIADGCGAPRVNKQEGGLKVNVELSLDERMGRVYEAWHQKYAGPNGEMSVYVREVFDTFVVAKSDKGGLWAYPYTVNEGEAVEFGQPYEVVIAYQDKESGMQINKWLSRIAEKLGIKSNELEENTVNEKQKLIAALVANTRCKLGEAALNKLDESELKTLSEQVAEEAPTPEPPPAAPVATPPPPVTDDLAGLRAEIAELKTLVGGVVGNLQANASQEKTEVITRLLAANQNTFSQAELNNFELPLLRKLAQAITPADYSMRGLPVMNSGNDADWAEYEQPAEPSLNGGAK